MKKFSKILEYVDHNYIVKANITLNIKTSNEGEAGYLSDSILGSVDNLVNFEIVDISEESPIKENLNPHDFFLLKGIDNFLDNPASIALMTAWLLTGKFSMKNMGESVENLKIGLRDFLDYCNLLGYPIESSLTISKFEELVNKVREIFKFDKKNQSLYEKLH